MILCKIFLRLMQSNNTAFYMILEIGNKYVLNARQTRPFYFSGGTHKSVGCARLPQDPDKSDPSDPGKLTRF